MRGTAETPDLILSGEIGVNKTINTESLNIYENGNYTPPAGVDGYDDIHVDVRPVIDSINIRENGTYEASGEVDGYSPVVVNVPQSAAKVYAKNINANGNYYPDAGYDGFSQVSVNVPATPLRPLNITENGEYNPPSGEGYSKVVVDVPTDPVIESINITENGTYAAPTGVDGYSPVIVNVPQPEDAYYIKDMTPGAIASFSDGADAPLNSLTASIVPVQAGSGDPSPTNVRPISGWSAVDVTRCGKNLFDKTTISENKILDKDTGKEITSYGRFTSDYIKANPSTNYYASNVIKSAQWYCAFYYDKNKNYLSLGELSSTEDIASGVITTPSNCNYVRIVSLTTYKDDVSFVVGNQAPTAYEPYNSTTTTIPFTDGQGQSVEVFGGSVDVVNGVVTPCPYYASYNGEQLTGEWISDRDVYSPNTSPTIGAQVVNIGATDTSFYTQPTSIKSLDGENNVFASTGDVLSGSYFSKTPD